MSAQHFGNLRLILSRFVVICAATLCVALVSGCMNICVDRSWCVSDEALCKQNGSFTLKGGEELDVYYPLPYSSPPNVTVKATFHEDNFALIGQYPDHFRVKNTGHFGREMTWESKGLRLSSPPLTLPVTPPPAGGLPSEPVPATGP
jgi:hypothetical protein